VRKRVFDHLDPSTVTKAARALSDIAATLEEKPPKSSAKH